MMLASVAVPFDWYFLPSSILGSLALFDPPSLEVVVLLAVLDRRLRESSAGGTCEAIDAVALEKANTILKKAPLRIR